MKNYIFTGLCVLAFLFTAKAQEKELQVYFDTDKHELDQQEVQKLQVFLDQNKGLEVDRLSLIAYCDDRGTEAYNLKLAERRAQEVVHQVLALGNATEILSTIEAKGELQLEGNTNPTEQRKLNRRVEVKVEFKEAAPVVKVIEEPEQRVVAEPLKKQKAQTLTGSHKVGDKIILQNILFEGGRDKLLPESYPALKELILSLRKYPQYHIVVYGHICCSPPGEDGEDLATGLFNLSEKRAEAVYRRLINNGIAQERLAYKGMKGDYPLGKGDKYDRRVEIEITKIVDTPKDR